MLQIVNFFKYVFEILKFFIDQIVNMFRYILSIITFVVRVFGALPTFLSVFIIAIVSVSIIYKIISLGGAGE